jgi:2-amino-4-hydroxy-6-hydroxymethyldihydropteridine diphosphokinase
MAVHFDDINYGVNYKRITKEVILLVENNKFNLVETLAERTWDCVKKIPHIVDVEVTVEKPNSLRFCDNVLVTVSDTDRYNSAIISLGSNIEPEQNVQKARLAISQIASVLKETKTITTKPLNFTDQDDFLNGAVLIQTKLYFEELVARLKQIEDKLGRVRTDNKNGPRTIDLDVVVFNNVPVDKEVHTLDFLTAFIQELQPGVILNEKG